MNIKKSMTSALLLVASFSVKAEEMASQAQDATRQIGVSAIWILANISYAGMRAQNSSSSGWRIVSFLFGFPGTFLSYLVVVEGSERAYGVDIPSRK
ncbi:hypothetical protein [Rhodanobacter sp. MP7CTX1]|jgi:hypothetical protein|uniref:hypothetical protein n=1 Tax=Rhodanobacter sp. MP7CTX1 TaxID=2723084 RepID=UPI00161DD096|nr:hypothetical protein [Rhodanobacter sp. MP7CTX1]MBB6188048.1 hypothetical protein [Rhodanobacter sp. MP7CTX1]